MKRYVLLLFSLSLVIKVYAQTTTISALPAASSIAGSDVSVMVQGGTTKQYDISLLGDLYQSASDNLTIYADITPSTDMQSLLAADYADMVALILDSITTTQGSIIYRSDTGWEALAPGTAGQALLTQGAGADPIWGSGGGGGGSSIILDLGDDSSFESSGVTLISVTGDDNSIFTEPTADKLLIAVGNAWPVANLAQTGDTATGFFGAGALERARGGLAADTSAYGTGLIGSDGSSATVDVDTMAEFVSALSITGTLDGSHFLAGDGSLKTVTASAPGSDTQVVYNDAGALGADADFSWNETSNILTVPTISTTTLNTNSFKVMDVVDQSNGLSWVVSSNLVADKTFTYVGTFNFTMTLSADSSVTFPTTGTLSTLAGSESLTNKDLTGTSNTLPCVFQVACSDLSNAITTGTTKGYFRAPHAFTLTAIRASVVTAPTGSTILIDVNETGTTVISTKVMIDATEKTSVTAATPYVISDSSIADDAEITIDFDQVGSTVAGIGVIVTLIGTY